MLKYFEIGVQRIILVNGGKERKAPLRLEIKRGDGNDDGNGDGNDDGNGDGNDDGNGDGTICRWYMYYGVGVRLEGLGGFFFPLKWFIWMLIAVVIVEES